MTSSSQAMRTTARQFRALKIATSGVPSHGSGLDYLHGRGSILEPSSERIVDQGWVEHTPARLRDVAAEVARLTVRPIRVFSVPCTHLLDDRTFCCHRCERGESQVLFTL